MILLSIGGFGPSTIDQSQRNGPVTPLVIAHGALTGAWLLLFLLQGLLVAIGRTTVHRLLGAGGAVLAPMSIVVGYFAIVAMLRRGYDLSGDIARGAVPPGSPAPGALDAWIPLAEFLTFGVLVAAGLWYRRRAEIHRRLMLLAVTVLALEPIFHFVGYLSGRWPSAWLAGAMSGTALQLLLLFASAIHDRVAYGRIHPVSLWVPLLLIAWVLALCAVVPRSAAWHQTAAWLVRGAH